MEAGRELDALIAEKVMGWKPWCSPMSPKGSTEPDCWRTGNKKSPTVKILFWTPSRNILAAWQVVEKLKAVGHHFLLLCSADSGLSIATFYMGPEDRSDLSATDFETPLAICLAALKAVGVVGNAQNTLRQPRK